MLASSPPAPEFLSFKIAPPDESLKAALTTKIQSKTKPLGSLGKLEEIAFKVGLIQNSLNPELINPTIIIFASDHGIAEEGVSAYPQEVTTQMVRNFLNGGAAINVFCNNNGLSLTVVDAGVNGDLPNHPALINAKLGRGTKNFLFEDAMTIDTCRDAVEKGASVIDTLFKNGCNVVGLGEMGIANSSAAALLMHLLCEIPLHDCVGPGTGLDTNEIEKKYQTLLKARERHALPLSPLRALAAFGGFEIAMLCGAYLKAAEHKMLILVDGFIASAAMLVAAKFHRGVLDYALFTHLSPESGHRLLLKHLDVYPILDLKMRLGEGTGAAVTYPIIKSAVSFLNHMASFEAAGVSHRHA